MSTGSSHFAILGISGGRSLVCHLIKKNLIIFYLNKNPFFLSSRLVSTLATVRRAMNTNRTHRHQCSEISLVEAGLTVSLDGIYSELTKRYLWAPVIRILVSYSIRIRFTLSSVMNIGYSLL